MPFLRGIGLPELIVILIIVLVIFGPRKLPEIGKSLGSAVRELRKSSAPEPSKEEKTDSKEEKAGSKKTEEVS